MVMSAQHNPPTLLLTAGHDALVVARRPALSRIMPSRTRVRAAHEELVRLADTLEEPGPVAAGGVAQARLLLTDGTGPLYNAESRTTLVGGAARAVRELRPWPT